MNSKIESNFDVKTVFGLLLFAACWSLLYWESLASLTRQWNNEDYSYCYLVPPLAAYLAYLNKDRLRRRRGGSTWPGYLLLGAAAMFFIMGRLGSLETITFVSMWVSIVAVSVLLFGIRSLRPLAFPLFVLAFAIPAPPFITNLLTFKLRLLSSSIAVDLLHLINFSAFREGNIIDLGFAQLQVVDACSGLRYLVSTILVALVAGYLFNKTLWERVLLVILAVPVSIVINSLRIVVVALLMRHVSVKFGEEGFYHDFSGWLIFLVSIGFVLALSAVLKKISQRKGNAQGSDEPATDGAAPAQSGSARISGWKHLVAASGIFLGLFFLQGALVTTANVPERKSFAGFPMQIGGWQGKRSYLDDGIINSLHTDDYVTASYFSANSGNVLYLLVPFYHFQEARRSAHAPTSCLLGSGWELKEKRVAPPDPASGRGFPVGQMVLFKGEERILANFWFQQRGRIITSEYFNKWYLFWDGVTRRRTDGALVRVEMVMRPGQTVEDAQAVLDGFTVPLRKVLREYIPE